MVATAYKVQILRYSQVHPDPDQPRKVFDEEAIESLASSIESEGLLQPISVRPAQDYKQLNQHSEYIIVAGERRWRAIGKLGWETIPALIVDLDAQGITKAQLLENAVRVDLDPVEEARALKSALDAGIELQSLAKALGRHPALLSWKMQILNAREDVLHLVSKGHITTTAGHGLSKLTHNGQGRVLRAIQMNKLSTKEIKLLCQRVWAEEKQSEMFTETKLTDEQVRAVRTFGSTFEDIAKALSKIEKMHEDNPQALQQAFSAESSILDHKITEAIKGLNKVRSMVTRNRIGEMEA